MSARPFTLAIDPGNEESAYALIDSVTCRPIQVDKIDNERLRVSLPELVSPGTQVAIEMVASYGMPVGREVFDTCVWVGRFYEALWCDSGHLARLVFRQPVKVHHCYSSKAKDGNIVQALVDRFTPGASNKGKGTKGAPGWFYGFHDDIWQAYALAVYVADTMPAGVTISEHEAKEQQ